MRKLIEFISVIALLFVVGAGGYSFFNLGIFNDIDAAVRVFDGLGWFVSLFAIATIFTSYLVVIADTKFIFRFLAIPAWLAFSFALLAALDQFIGYPYPGVPPKSQVLQYRVITNEDRTKTIEAWMYLSSDYRTRVYAFPHTPNREEAMHEAMQGNARGELIEVDIVPDDRITGDDPFTVEEMIRKYDIPHEGLPLKEGEQPTVQTGQPQQLNRKDKVTLQLPDGTVIEIQPGNSFTITDTGEIEIFNNKRVIPYSEHDEGRDDGGGEYSGTTGRGRGANYVPDYDSDLDFESAVAPR